MNKCPYLLQPGIFTALLCPFQSDEGIPDKRQFVMFYVCYGFILIEFVIHSISDVDAMGDAYPYRKTRLSTEETPLLGGVRQLQPTHEKVCSNKMLFIMIILYFIEFQKKIICYFGKKTNM